MFFKKRKKEIKKNLLFFKGNNKIIKDNAHCEPQEIIINSEEYERERIQKKREEKLASYGYTFESLEEAKRDANARNYHNGKYHNDKSKPAGSIDNPNRVGMDGGVEILFFNLEQGEWQLTDGLGNGYIR